MEAYEQLIPAGEQISYFIYFEVDPANIDVNIHPTKTEIKFENEQAIWQILSASVKESLGKFSAIPSIAFDRMAHITSVDEEILMGAFLTSRFRFGYISGDFHHSGIHIYIEQLLIELFTENSHNALAQWGYRAIEKLGIIAIVSIRQ